MLSVSGLIPGSWAHMTLSVDMLQLADQSIVWWKHACSRYQYQTSICPATVSYQKRTVVLDRCSPFCSLWSAVHWIHLFLPVTASLFLQFHSFPGFPLYAPFHWKDKHCPLVMQPTYPSHACRYVAVNTTNPSHTPKGPCNLKQRQTSTSNSNPHHFITWLPPARDSKSASKHGYGGSCSRRWAWAEGCEF